MPKTNEPLATLHSLGMRPCQGKTITGDAMVTHRDVASAIRYGGGHKVLIVKENQPALQEQIRSALPDDREFFPHQRRQKAA